MTSYTLYQVDSFTRTKFKGNPAGVVVNADGLSDSRMQEIARELNNSETSFLFKPDDDSCDGVIRYFTPTVEVPICGHATIAAMYAKGLEESLDSGVFNMKTRVGVLPFEMQKAENGLKIWMTQGRIEIHEPLADDYRKALFAYLGLGKDDIDTRCPVQIASTGHSKVMIGIKGRETLNALTPNYGKLAELSEQIGCNGYYVFTLTPDSSDILTRGRMFAPAIGIQEDPVTGNANGPLGAYLVHNKLVDCEPDGVFRFKGAQGEAMGRDGVVEVSVTVKGGEPDLVKIAGEAVTVFRATLEI